MVEQSAAVLDRRITQRGIRGQRLFFEDVERRASDPALLQRYSQSMLLHDRPTGGVDEICGGFHHSQSAFIEQVVRRSSSFVVPEQGNGDADEIASGQCLFKTHVLNQRFLLLNAKLMAQVHNPLNGSNVAVILKRGVVAQDVHLHSGALLDQSKSYSTCANDRHRLASHLVPQKGKKWMPCSPTTLAYQFFAGPELASHSADHEESKFGGGFGENVGRVGERHFIAVGVLSVDVVEADRDLCDDLKFSFAGLEHFRVNG